MLCWSSFQNSKWASYNIFRFYAQLRKNVTQWMDEYARFMNRSQMRAQSRKNHILFEYVLWCGFWSRLFEQTLPLKMSAAIFLCRLWILKIVLQWKITLSSKANAKWTNIWLRRGKNSVNLFKQRMDVAKWIVSNWI